MSQQKSTSFSAAKVANFGVVMVEIILEMSELKKKVKRLHHHVLVLSKKNHRLVKDGKSGAVLPIPSGANLRMEEGSAGVRRWLAWRLRWRQGRPPLRLKLRLRRWLCVTGAPYREVNSKVATAPNTQSRR